MKIYSWNVNGLRAVIRKNAIQNFLEKERPDILCLQEIKCTPDQLDYNFQDYRVIWNPAKKSGYSGTAMLISEHQNSFASKSSEEIDIAVQEGRIIVEDFGNFYLVDVYVPNSKPDLSRLKLRHENWDPDFLNLLKELEKTKPVVTCGDFNAAHTEIDLARPKQNHHNAGFTDEERQGITNLLNAGFIDTFRFLHPNEQRYTWWSHWGNARANNVGWRIDYFFISKSLEKNLKSAEIHEQITGSDHCPVSIELEF